MTFKTSLSKLLAVLSAASFVAASAAGEVLTCSAIAEAGDGTSARVLLFPMGETALRGHGRSVRLVDEAHAREVIAASVRHAGAANIPVDYDHQLVFGAQKGVGGQAPAAGWIDPASLTVDAAGIWADVQWTQAAADRLAAREYRYVSPSFFAAKDGRLALIAHLSLVNYPAITDLPAVAAAFQPENPNMKEIALALGLAADATMEAILAAIAQMGGAPQMPASMATAAAALGLGADATADQIFTAAAAAATPDPAKFVPVAALTDTQARLATLEDERRGRIITAAAAAGKITPALRPWAEGFIKKDEAGFEAWLAQAPAIVTAGADLTGQPEGDNAFGLTATEIQVASATGVTLEAFAAAKKA